MGIQALTQIGKDLNVEGATGMRKQDLIFQILKAQTEQSGFIFSEGVLEAAAGRLRVPARARLQLPARPRRHLRLAVADPPLRPAHRRHDLGTDPAAAGRGALLLAGQGRGGQLRGARPRAREGVLREPHAALPAGDDPAGDGADNLSARVMDLMTPIGKGQRGLIVAPPRTGKTMLLQSIAQVGGREPSGGVLIVLLIDERPEEVTDMQRSVKGEVISSTFDEPAQRHVQVAEMVIEKAKRLVEHKKDVLILLDSITRLARAYNTVAPSSGKVLSGGLDSNALQKPKRFFGAARNIEDGGSLTIVATALIDTGSRMDDVIFEEFKGTGNSEIHLDRKLADKRVFPAIDITKSGTRKEELLIPREDLNRIWVLRKVLNPLSGVEAMELLLDKLGKTKSNADFLGAMQKKCAVVGQRVGRVDGRSRPPLASRRRLVLDRHVAARRAPRSAPSPTPAPLPCRAWRARRRRRPRPRSPHPSRRPYRRPRMPPITAPMPAPAPTLVASSFFVPSASNESGCVLSR
jgi:transcription termination factor Rho